MARLKLSLFGNPRDELAATVDGEVPEWIERIYDSFGVNPDDAPASASVLALGESLYHRLRKLSLLLVKMETLGWTIEPRRWDLLAGTELDDVQAQQELGNVRWSHGVVP